MKKIHLMGIIALATLSISSCTNDDFLSDERIDNAIGFSTYLGRDAQTRGTVLDNTVATGLPKQGFGVFAYYTEGEDFNATKHTNPDFMKNTKVTSTDGTNWTYAPLKYWPNNTGDKVSFFAYAPYDADYNITGSSLEFTVNPIVKNQIDLTWNASTTPTTNLTKKTTTGTVDFKFYHALSKVGFKVQAATDEVSVGSNALDANTVINIKRIILSGADVVYTPAVSPATEGTYTATNIFTKTATLNLNTFGTTTAAWTSPTETQHYTLTEENFDDCKQLTSTNSKLSTNQLNEDDSYLFILPQDLSTSGFKVFVEYDVVTTDPSIGGNDGSTITNRINQTAKVNFESGKAYTLNLVLGMTSIKVSVDMNPWDEQANTPVDVPKNS